LTAAVVIILLRTGGSKAVADNAAIIGALIALCGVFIAQMVSIALEAGRAQEAALQNYFERVGKLLIEHPLRRASPGDNLSTLVRAHTLSLLESLDPDRKRMPLLFLYEAKLVHKSKPVVSLQAANLSKANLRGVHLFQTSLRDLFLSKANLSEAVLPLVDLSGTFLEEADLSKAHLLQATLELADLSDANLSGASLLSANLLDAKLLRADLSRADLSSTNLNGADLSNANLAGADLSDANLFAANLSGVDLSNAKLNRALLRGANLTDARLQGTDLSDVVQDFAEFGLSEKEQGNTLVGAGSDYSVSVTLSRADLSGADLSNADLRNADLRGAKGVTKEKLEQQAKRLTGAIMPGGQRHGVKLAAIEFKPALSYDPRDGWSIASEVDYLLVFKGQQEGEQISFASHIDHVIDPSNPIEPTLVPAPKNVEDWTSWFQRHPNFDTSNPVSVTIGGAAGMQIDVTLSPTSGDDYLHLLPGMVMVQDEKDRYIIVDVEDETVVVRISSPVDDFDEFLPKAQKMLETVEWG